jgi:hypothetical protein
MSKGDNRKSNKETKKPKKDKVKPADTGGFSITKAQDAAAAKKK